MVKFPPQGVVPPVIVEIGEEAYASSDRNVYSASVTTFWHNVGYGTVTLQSKSITFERKGILMAVMCAVLRVYTADAGARADLVVDGVVKKSVTRTSATDEHNLIFLLFWRGEVDEGTHTVASRIDGRNIYGVDIEAFLRGDGLYVSEILT